MRTELDIQTLQKAKTNATAFYQASDEDGKKFWEQVIKDCDEEIIEIAKEMRPVSNTGVAIMIIIALILLLAICSCTTTIRGTGQMISGIGQGGGTIVKGFGDYLQEEMEGK